MVIDGRKAAHAVAMVVTAGMIAPVGEVPLSLAPQAECPTFPAASASPPAAPCGFRCGVERWPVKTLTDQDRERVDFRPRRATVTELGQLPVPARRPADRRAGEAELHVYCVDAWIIDEPRPQEDGDLHLVLAGIEDPTSRMIAEIPEVRCATVCASRYAAAFAAARETAERRLATWDTDTLRVRIVGVGFFDRNHGQTGAAPNYFELHPVLAVQFP